MHWEYGEYGGQLEVKFCVHKGEQMVGDDSHLFIDGNHMVYGNSDDLHDIQGQLYHYMGVQKWDSGTWAPRGTDGLPVLRFQLPVQLQPLLRVRALVLLQQRL